MKKTAKQIEFLASLLNRVENRNVKIDGFDDKTATLVRSIIFEKIKADADAADKDQASVLIGKLTEAHGIGTPNERDFANIKELIEIAGNDYVMGKFADLQS